MNQTSAPVQSAQTTKSQEANENKEHTEDIEGREEKQGKNVQECTQSRHTAPIRKKPPLQGPWGRPKRRVETPIVPTNVENKPTKKRKALEPPQQIIPHLTKTAETQETFRQVLQRKKTQKSIIQHQEEEEVKPLIQDLPRLSARRAGTNSDQDLTLTSSTPVPTNTSDSGTDSNSDCSSDTRSQAPSASEYKKALLYRTVKKIRVRAEPTIDGAEVGILEKGTVVKLVTLDERGRKGRIVEPLDGWVSMTKGGKKQLDQIFKGTPTICLRGLSKRLFRNGPELLQTLRQKNINPTRCDWKQPNNCAFVEFATHKDAQRLMKTKINVNGVSLKIDWSNRYRNEVSI